MHIYFFKVLFMKSPDESRRNINLWIKNTWFCHTIIFWLRCMLFWDWIQNMHFLVGGAVPFCTLLIKSARYCIIKGFDVNSMIAYILHKYDFMWYDLCEIDIKISGGTTQCQKVAWGAVFPRLSFLEVCNISIVLRSGFLYFLWNNFHIFLNLNYRFAIVNCET